MIDEIKNNIENEMFLLREIYSMMTLLKESSAQQKSLLESVIESHKRKLKIINDSMEDLLEELSVVKKLPGGKNESRVEKLDVDKASKSSFILENSNSVSVKRRDKDKFLNELSISRDLLEKLNTKRKKEGDFGSNYKKPRRYAKMANSSFRGISEKILSKNWFKGLKNDLSRSNMHILPTTYISMMLMGVFLGLIGGILLTFFLLFFKVSLTFPFIESYSGNLILRFIKIFWVIFAVPLITGLVFYFYPYTEKKSLSSRIDNELPFVAIHMASISGSGIEPSQIFRILSTSKDYKYTGGELKKLTNQINVYGFNLVTALKNIAATTPSRKLAELLKGLATNIMTGGDLSSFFDKRSETLLLQYKLERERFAKTAETFMDIYISVVIAAPMILLLLLIMISVSGISIGYSTSALTLGIILIVGVVNILFLIFLGMKQPGY